MFCQALVLGSQVLHVLIWKCHPLSMAPLLGPGSSCPESPDAVVAVTPIMLDTQPGVILTVSSSVALSLGRSELENFLMMRSCFKVVDSVNASDDDLVPDS